MSPGNLSPTPFGMSFDVRRKKEKDFIMNFISFSLYISSIPKLKDIVIFGLICFDIFIWSIVTACNVVNVVKSNFCCF
jgi:hypothetical protein